ncbi:MAG TPA: hypothetical protein VK843_02835 [Planctomycetota bacterium]|nr:hypothetical protein [Planctomycetota bacterium]
MKTETAPLALRDFTAQLGREEPLYVVHGGILRAAHSVRPVVESGAMLAACSDEFNGEVRAAFEVDVARMLTAPNIPGTRRIFSVSNLGGRIEPGAIALANLHFTALSAQAGEKLLLVEIASHVGRRETSGGSVWGELDRFGTPSPCCGALQLLLDNPANAAAVRFPWFDQLNAFFGPDRLSVLRADKSPHRMLRAAIVHAVLQSESAVVDLIREPPTTRTHVLIASLVVVNRRGTDNAIPVGLHHLRFEAGEVQILFGSSLRSTPAALAVDASQTNLRVTSPFTEDVRTAPPPLHHPPPIIPAMQRMQAKSEAVQAQVAAGRKQLHSLRGHPSVMRVYARPLLRAFIQGLSIAAPEVALAAFALEGGRDFFRAAHMKALLERGPSTAEARKILHDLEPTLQQLGHREAREVLETLLAEHNSLFGTPIAK